MTVKSPKKKDLAVNIKIESEDGTSSLLERKDRVKYLGALLDGTVSFKHHISSVASRISRSNGIMAKLRHFLTLSQIRQYLPLRLLRNISMGKCVQILHKENTN